MSTVREAQENRTGESQCYGRAGLGRVSVMGEQDWEESMSWESRTGESQCHGRAGLRRVSVMVEQD